MDENQNDSGPDFSTKTKEFLDIVPTLVTKDNWKSQCMDRPNGGFEYLEGTEHVLKLVDTIISQKTSFEKMKEELTQMLMERYDTIHYAEKNAP